MVMRVFTLRSHGLFYMKNDIKKSGYWIGNKPWGIYKLTNWLDWRIDLKWWSYTIWIERL